MDRLTGVVLLACVCVGLVLVSGGVASGRVEGFNYGGVSVGGLLKWLGVRGNVTEVITKSSPTGISGNSTTVAGKPGGAGSSKQASAIDFAAFLPAIPDWLLATVGIVFFGSAALLLLRPRIRVNVVDLEGTLKAMEEQRQDLERSWSYKVRNAALLRYYLLMRRACLKVGLRDEPAETPQEYVQRISTYFGVEKSDASQFASAVNRSRYGLELSDADAKEASKFMGLFADVIRRKAGETR